MISLHTPSSGKEGTVASDPKKRRDHSGMGSLGSKSYTTISPGSRVRSGRRELESGNKPRNMLKPHDVTSSLSYEYSGSVEFLSSVVNDQSIARRRNLGIRNHSTLSKYLDCTLRPSGSARLSPQASKSSNTSMDRPQSHPTLSVWTRDLRIRARRV